MRVKNSTKKIEKSLKKYFSTSRNERNTMGHVSHWSLLFYNLPQAKSRTVIFSGRLSAPMSSDLIQLFNLRPLQRGALGDGASRKATTRNIGEKRCELSKKFFW
jgi:hypothetical protein